MVDRPIIAADYNGLSVHFTEEAWFNATEAAERFGKRPNDWLALDDTKAYLTAVENTSVTGIPNTPKNGDLIRTKRGKNGGTWLHPMLAVSFARWLDPAFAVWCDGQIYALIRGQHPHNDWKRMRHEATASFKVMQQILQETRAEIGKASAPHHFSNEARLINFAMTGEFGSVDRNSLDTQELDLLASLEVRNTVLIGRGVDYAKRKVLLEQHAADWRIEHHPAPLLAATSLPATATGIA